MHQSQKGNQYHFGMKVSAGVNKNADLIRSLVITPANAHN